MLSNWKNFFLFKKRKKDGYFKIGTNWWYKYDRYKNNFLLVPNTIWVGFQCTFQHFFKVKGQSCYIFIRPQGWVLPQTWQGRRKDCKKKMTRIHSLVDSRESFGYFYPAGSKSSSLGWRWGHSFLPSVDFSARLKNTEVRGQGQRVRGHTFI